jgi:hypothetical protein
MKIQVQQLSIIASIVCLSFCSCNYLPAYDPYYISMSRQKENIYYAPSGANAPLLTNKNDGSLTIGGSLTSKTKGGINLQAAYLPAKHIGLTANYSSTVYQGSSSHFEIGPGYVKKLSEYWSFETYGGAGFGNRENHHATGYSKIKTSNVFIQPTISVGGKEQKFQFAFVSRFNRVNFTLGDTTFNNDREYFVTQQMKLIAEKPVHLFWEPGFIMRAGWKNVLIQAGYQISTDLTNSNLQYAKENFSVGLVVRLNTAKKKN